MTAMARQKCWWCRNWSCLRSGGTWLVHLMSVALALPLNRPAGFGIAGRQCNSLQYNGLLLFWPPPALVLVHYSTLHDWRKQWRCPFPHCAQIFIFIVNQNEKLILDQVWSCCTISKEYSATFSHFGESKTILYYAMLRKGVIITCYWTIGNTLYDEIQRTIISDKNESGNM